MTSMFNPWRPDALDMRSAHYYSSEGLDEWYDYSADNEEDEA